MLPEHPSFREFYPAYLAEHSKPATRRLHFAGILVALLLVVVTLWSRDWRWLLAAPVFGYGLSWIGHLVFEGNRPATFRHPLYSLLGDLVMFKDILLRRVSW